MKFKLQFFVIFILVFIADQTTKYLIVRFLKPYESVQVLPIFQIVNVKNTGAAFGMFPYLDNRIFIGISIIAIIFIIIAFSKSEKDRFGFSLILSGAIGNLVDRIRFGYVVDFIDIHIGNYHWPAFNLADSALTIGIFLIFLQTFFSYRHL